MRRGEIKLEWEMKIEAGKVVNDEKCVKKLMPSLPVQTITNNIYCTNYLIHNSPRKAHIN